MTYLLDSNTWIAYFRQKDLALIQKIQQTDPNDIRLCSVVLGELYYGAYHGAPAKLAQNLAFLTQLRQRFLSLPFDDGCVEEYGRIRADLAFRGETIGPNDTMIAAIALVHGLTLVTNNTNEFSRVPGLALEDGQAP